MRIQLSGMGSLGDAAYDSLLASFVARGLSPANFQLARPGRSLPDPVTCLKIQCGAITQDQAGNDLLADCSFAGFAGAQSCADPLCAPYCGQAAASVARASQPLPVAERVALQFLQPPSSGCDKVYSGPHFGGPYEDAPLCGCGFVTEFPFLAMALVGLAGYGVYRWRAGR